MSEKSENEWHLDKRFNVSIVVGILMQTVGMVWWASEMSQRVEHVEAAAKANGTEITVLQRQLSAQMRDIAVLVEQIKNTNSSLDRLRDEIAQTNAIIRENVQNRGRRHEQP